MKSIVVMPIIIPLAGAAVALLVRRRRALTCLIGVATMAALFGASLFLLRTVWVDGIQVMQVGNWPAPFGISLVADTFSAIMVCLAGLIGFATAVYSTVSIDARRQSFGYFTLLNVLLMGICGAFLTGDLFNLYVWFEVMLIASFVLLVLGGERAQMEGAIKYVTLNLLSSSIFLAAVGILYGLTGTLNMADLAVKLSSPSVAGVRTAVSMLFLIAFGIKSAVFPLFFWLPASYHTPPAAVTAVFAGLLTKVGVYSLIRVFTLLFVHDVPRTHTIITILAGLSMVTGVLGAAAQFDFRRLLSFHIISQIGYMLLGLGLFTRAALIGSIFYIVHNVVVKTNLVLVSGVARRLGGSYDLKKLGGLYRNHPWLAILFFVSAMALAGIPPLSGFFAKLSLVQAGLEIDDYAVVGTALFVSILTLFSMTKIWGEAFWAPAVDDILPAAKPNAVERLSLQTRIMYAPIVLLAALAVMMGLGAESMLILLSRAAEELLNPGGYVDAVMKGRS